MERKNMINLEKDNYIILEIIPTNSDETKGAIAQLQALKLQGLKLVSRFDYRLNEDLISNKDILNMISYDKQNFKYVDKEDIILRDFIKWIEDYPLLLIDNTYTLNYLKNIKNNKELVYPYLKLNYDKDVFTRIINKYNLESSNHLVDLVYEAIIYESGY